MILGEALGSQGMWPNVNFALGIILGMMKTFPANTVSRGSWENTSWEKDKHGVISHSFSAAWFCLLLLCIGFEQFISKATFPGTAVIIDCFG